MDWCGLAAARPAHWVPDAHALCCFACGTSFGALVRRHHCRCCGAVFCHACSSRSTSLPGWGLEQSVRACEECYSFEVSQLPVLLAGDLFWRTARWTGTRSGRYLRLSADQSAIIWTTWRDDSGAETSAERTLPLSNLRCVSVAQDGHRIELHKEGGEMLSFEAEAAQTAAWAAALARLVAILKQRHSYERLYGGRIESFSPRSKAILAPRIRLCLERRQQQLVSSNQAKLTGIIPRRAMGAGRL